jgi:hypothetical protein
METITREAAIADYLACAERFPRFEGKPGELLAAAERMRSIADPVTGLVTIPARALRFCDQVDGRFPRAMADGIRGSMWVAWSDGSAGLIERDALITVRPGRGKF